jgi:hypothetical protein
MSQICRSIRHEFVSQSKKRVTFLVELSDFDIFKGTFSMEDEYHQIGGIVTAMRGHAMVLPVSVDILPLLKFLIDDHRLRPTPNTIPWTTKNEKLVEKLISSDDVRRLVNGGAIRSMVLWRMTPSMDDDDAVGPEMIRLLRIRAENKSGMRAEVEYIAMSLGARLIYDGITVHMGE